MSSVTQGKTTASEPSVSKFKVRVTEAHDRSPKEFIVFGSPAGADIIFNGMNQRSDRFPPG